MRPFSGTHPIFPKSKWSRGGHVWFHLQWKDRLNSNTSYQSTKSESCIDPSITPSYHNPFQCRFSPFVLRNLLFNAQDQYHKHVQIALKQECTLLYQSHLNDTSRLYIRNLPLRADLFNCLFVQDLQIQKTSTNKMLYVFVVTLQSLDVI